VKELARGQSIIEKPVLTNRFVEALGYAAELHLHQRRKGKGQPMSATCSALRQSSFNTAAVKMKSSPRCCMMLSKTGRLPRSTKFAKIRRPRRAYRRRLHGSYEVSGEKRDWGERKRAYIEKVAHELDDVRLVSAADKLANAREILSDYRAEATPSSTASPAASRARFGTTARSSMSSAKPAQTHSSTNSTA